MRRLALLVAALALASVATARADDSAYAPLDQPGVALDVPQAKLAASLQCEPSVANAKVEPVLLNPATGVTVDQNYSWNWEPALDKLGIPWCAYHAPDHTLNDIQVSGEYLVYAIRTMYAMAGRKIAVMGHSQGGMSMRWPLRFWPDTRAMVEDVIGFSGSNHGTTTLGGGCPAGCPPASIQQGADSKFIEALNSLAETFPGISYTEIYTHTDEVVDPATGPNPSAALHTGGGNITNVATQDVCPLDVYEHLTVGTVDPVAYALGVDALTHSGPANAARVPRSVCSQLEMPGVDPANANMYIQILQGLPGLLAVDTPGVNIVGVPEVTKEPALACYVFAACPGETTAAGKPTCTSQRRFTLRVPKGVRGAVVRLNGKRLRVTHGRVKIDLRGRGPRTVVVRITGTGRGGKRVRITHRYRPCVARA